MFKLMNITTNYHPSWSDKAVHFWDGTVLVNEDGFFEGTAYFQEHCDYIKGICNQENGDLTLQSESYCYRANKVDSDKYDGIIRDKKTNEEFLCSIYITDLVEDEEIVNSKLFELVYLIKLMKNGFKQEGKAKTLKKEGKGEE